MDLRDFVEQLFDAGSFRSVAEVAILKPRTYERQAIRRRRVQRAAVIDRIAPNATGSPRRARPAAYSRVVR